MFYNRYILYYSIYLKRNLSTFYCQFYCLFVCVIVKCSLLSYLNFSILFFTGSMSFLSIEVIITKFCKTSSNIVV